MEHKDKKKNILITFPDGKKLKYNKGVRGIEIAGNISKSLEKKSVAVKVNGELKDLSDEINNDSKVEIITNDTESGLEIMRHTLTAQVLAKAIKNLYPKSKLAIGPTIENGFYYDVLLEKTISNEDLPKIENEMKKIVLDGNKIKKIYVSKEEALKLFSNKDETYKIEIIKESKQKDNFQIYCQDNTDFFDLCYGPHLPNLKHIGAFKLTKVAGAYWKGDSNNEMLQRIYGTAWNNQKDLETHLNMLKEAEKRDHRLLGSIMNLYHFQEEAPGSVFWHPDGWTLFQTLLNYMRKKQNEAGYLEINTPDIMDRSLWEKSGHWEKFGENMFTTTTKEEKTYAIKPMNCPGGIQVFNQGIKSYRDLPLKISEFGKVHRYEPSGALHGLMRVRAFTQDDAHIFCTEDQLEKECQVVCKLIISIYKDFGFNDIAVKYSDRPEKRVGSDEVWDKSEKALLSTIDNLGIPYTINPGEGAFYGPKLEFVLRDAIGRDWQCGTVQIDLNLPERLSCNYINKAGEKMVPVLIHRALFGSLERFIGILIEHYAGRLPLWLSPVNVAIVTINNKFDEYASNLKDRLLKEGITCKLDLRNEKVGYKIREHSSTKIPLILVIGEKEVESNTVALRKLGSQDIEISSIEKIINLIKHEKNKY
ncbi:MAG: threonine--tRNA ligase [Pelagibacterales bacterium]|nr:threonine--tRNA ligase [Pelagibacterales bacterium]